jgi:5-methylthioadenosine/S-adenosylhomocysteine deaminase
LESATPTDRADWGNSATLVQPRWLVPVRPRGVVLDRYSVLLRDGAIAGLLPRAEAERSWPDALRLELPDHVLLPGLVNCHTHSPMTLLRGYADDLDLHIWLQEHIWPAERQLVGPEFARDGSLLAIAEMIRSGTTCFNDMYFFPDATADACLGAGMRACIGMIVTEFESSWARDAQQYLEKGLRLRERHAGSQLLTFSLAPHAPYTVEDDSLRRVARLSEKLGIPVHIHLLETEWEIKQSLQQHDQHPLTRLDQLGLLNDRLQAVHMVQLSAEDIERVAERGVHVVHCPQSNLKLASGFCPLQSLDKAGVNVALGTDGAASNNNLDLLSEAQTAALLAKGVAGDARAASAFEVLEMLTLNGARALGLADRIGSIEPGKQADLCALNLSAPETQPVHHVISQLIYAASARQVSDVWIAGRRVLESGRLTTIDTEEVLGRARRWRDRLSASNGGRAKQERDSAA